MHRQFVSQAPAHSQSESPASPVAVGRLRLLGQQLSCGLVFLLASATLIAGSALALVQLPLLTFNDDPRQIFSSNTEEFHRYLEFSRLFPHEQNDVTAIITGPLLTASALQALRRATNELPKLAAVETSSSLFSEPSLAQEAVAIINAQTSADESAFRENLARLQQDSNFLPGRILSTDLQTSVLHIGLSASVTADSALLREASKELDSALDQLFINTGLSFNLTGFPALRVAVRQQVFHDMLLFGALAVVFSSIVAWLMFRSVVTVSLALIGPMIGVLWTFGAMTVIGHGVNVLTQMVAVLILVIGFSDSVHITRFVRAGLLTGRTQWSIILGSYKRLALPCLLTSLTTAAGFLSLCLSDSDLLREFGLVCATGSVLGFLSVMLCVPLMTMGLALQGSAQSTGHTVNENPGEQPAKNRWRGLPARWDRWIIGLGVCLTFALVGLAVQVEPQYQLGENLPKSNPARIALQDATEHLGGALPLHVMLSLPPVNEQQAGKVRSNNEGRRRSPADTSTSALLKAVREVQKNLNNETGLTWYSSINASRYAPGFGVLNRLSLLPDSIAERQLNRPNQAALISTVIPAQGSDQIEQQIKSIESVLQRADSDASITLRTAGFTTILGSTSQQMIGDLAFSLLGAIVLMLIITATLFRSVKLGLISLVPNLAPVALLAAILVLADQPLRYSTVVIFSICLGIAIDDTVHIMERFRQGRLAGLLPAEAVQRSLYETTPVLILTTAIMGAGFASLMFSPTATLSWMGFLSCIALLSALVIDLTLLPALLRRFC